MPTLKETIMYTTKSCKGCLKGKELLNNLGKNFIEKDIKDEGNLAEMINETGQMTVPVFKIGNKIIVGFNRREIESSV